MVRSCGVDLQDEDVWAILDATVQVGSISEPRFLFQCRPKQKWNDISHNASCLSRILEASRGLIPRQVKFHLQVRE